MDTQRLQTERACSLAIDAEQQRRLADEFHLKVARRRGWLQLSLRPGRQKALSFVTLLFGVVLLSSGQLVPELGASSGAVSLAATGFGVSLLLLSLYLPFSSMDLEISRRKIRRIRRWLGLAISVREIRSEDVYELAIDAGFSNPVNGACTLTGIGAFGRIRLIEHIHDPALMEALRRQIMLAAGLRPSGTH